MKISIIIPAFNESKKIEKDIRAGTDFLRVNNFTGELIVVDDGSTDGTSQTAEAVLLSSPVSLRVIRNEQHRGKGFAVRTGVNTAKGEIIMFADSGLCIPYQFVLKGIQMLELGNCDIAHGSRKLKDSVIITGQPLHRRMIAKIFRWIFIIYLKVPKELTDTQCGFKIYKKHAAQKLYDECVTDGFLFDIEIILRARKHKYLIKEFPVEWRIDPDSRLLAFRNSYRVLKELITIRRLTTKL